MPPHRTGTGAAPVTLTELRAWRTRLEQDMAALKSEGIVPPGATVFRRAMLRLVGAGAEGCVVYAEDLNPLIQDCTFLGSWRLERFGVDSMADVRVAWIEFLTRWRDGLSAPAPAATAPFDVEQEVTDLLWAYDRTRRREQLGAEFIRERRLERRLTQGELGAKIGVTARTVMRWEGGRTEPDLAHRRLLVEVLGGVQAHYQWEV